MRPVDGRRADAQPGRRRRRPNPDEEDDGLRPLSDRLVTELTAHRTLALRDALAGDPQTAFLAALHALACGSSTATASTSCLEIEPKSAVFGAQAPGLGRHRLGPAIDARHRALDESAAEGARGPLGRARRASTTTAARRCSRIASSLTVNAVDEAYNRRPAGDRPCRPARDAARPRHGGGGLDADGRRLSRPRHQGAASSRRCARRRARTPPSASPGSRRPRWSPRPRSCSSGTGWLPEPLRTHSRR